MNTIISKMIKQKTALVLGGIVNHIPLIQKLKEKGFYTILIDYLNHPPAKRFADEHLQISTFDFELIERIAKEREVNLIINCTLEHLNKGICKISERLGLSSPYSYETALLISNKEYMKAKMIESGIPTSKYCCVENEDEIDFFSLKMPVYVKPAQGSGSTSVHIAHNVDEIKRYVTEAKRVYPNSKVIVEEEARGEEYNVYCFPLDGESNTLMIARRYSDDMSGDKVTKCIGIIGPASISSVAKEKIEDTIQKISKSFNLNNVPMFMQIMIDGDNINVIEFAGRMAGGFSSMAILETTGFDLYDATINSFLGIKNQISFHEPKEYITVSSVYAHSCVFDRVIGYERLKEENKIVDIVIPRESGTIINDTTSNGGKVAFIIAKDESLSGLIEKIDDAYNSIDVLDSQGKSQIKRDIHIKHNHIETILCGG